MRKQFRLWLVTGTVVGSVIMLAVVCALFTGCGSDGSGGDGEEIFYFLSAWQSNYDLTGGGGNDSDIHFSRLRAGESGFTPAEPLNSNSSVDVGSDSYPSLAAGDSGNWVAVWVTDDNFGGTVGTDRDVAFARSTDSGATWSSVAVLNDTASSDSDADDSFPRIANNGSGTWITAWFSEHDLSGAGTDLDILYTRSVDSGATWEATSLLNDSGSGDTGSDENVSLAGGRNGTWIAVWNSDEDLGGAGADHDIFYARSTDNGLSWSSTTLLFGDGDGSADSDTDPLVATDGQGRWIIVWSSLHDLGSATGPDQELLYVRSTDDGMTWSSVETLNTNATTDIGADADPRIATDGAGTWIVTWYTNNLGGTTGDDEDIAFARSTDNGATWSTPAALNSTAESDDDTADTTPAVSTDGQGNWLVIWESYELLGGGLSGDRDIVGALSADNGVTWSEPAMINSFASEDGDAFDGWAWSAAGP
jgi:hypothetical protein